MRQGTFDTVARAGIHRHSRLSSREKALTAFVSGSRKAVVTTCDSTANLRDTALTNLLVKPAQARLGAAWDRAFVDPLRCVV